MKTLILLIWAVVVVLAEDAEKKIQDEGRHYQDSRNSDERSNFPGDNFNYRPASHEDRDDRRFQPELKGNFDVRPETFREDHGHPPPQYRQHDFGRPNVHDASNYELHPFREENYNDESSAEHEEETIRESKHKHRPQVKESSPDLDNGYRPPEIETNGHRQELHKVHNNPDLDVKALSNEQKEADAHREEDGKDKPVNDPNEDSDSEQQQPSIKYEQIPEKQNIKQFHRQRKPERRPIYPSRGPKPVRILLHRPSFSHDAEAQNPNRHFKNPNQYANVPQLFQIIGDHRHMPVRYNIPQEQMQFKLHQKPQLYHQKPRPRPKQHEDRQRFPHYQHGKVVPQRRPSNPHSPPQRQSNIPEVYHQSFNLPPPPPPPPPHSPTPSPHSPTPSPHSPPPSQYSPPPHPHSPPPPQYSPPPPQYSPPPSPHSPSPPPHSPPPPPHSPPPPPHSPPPPPHSPPPFPDLPPLPPSLHPPPPPSSPHYHSPQHPHSVPYQPQSEIPQPSQNHNVYQGDVPPNSFNNGYLMPPSHHQKQLHNPVDNFDISSEDHRSPGYEEQGGDSNMHHANSHSEYNIPVNKQQYKVPDHIKEYDGKTRTEISEFGYSVYHPSYTYSFSSYPSGYKLESNTLHDRGLPRLNADYVRQRNIPEKQSNTNSGDYSRS